VRWGEGRKLKKVNRNIMMMKKMAVRKEGNREMNGDR